MDETKTLDSALARLEADADSALRAATTLTQQLKSLKASASCGQLKDVEKAVAGIGQQANLVSNEAESLAASWSFDPRKYLEDGSYVNELLAALEKEGLKAIYRDGRVLCFPSLLRVVPNDLAVEVDRKKVRKIRPSVIAQELKRRQGKKGGLKPEQFIEILFAAYTPLASQRETGRIIRLHDIYDLLTLLPQATEYALQEFARDLLQLDMSNVRATKSGAAIRFTASTGARTSSITAITPHGETRIYSGVEFSS